MSILDLLFGRPSDPAAQLTAWLKGRSLDDRFLTVGILYGGPHSLKVCKWALAQPDCDKGTAAMLLWEFGWPNGVISGAEPPLQDRIKRELIAFIVDRWQRGLLAPATFPFDPKENAKLYRRELKKKGLQGTDPFDIPEEAWQPIAGRPPAASPTYSRGQGTELAAILGALRLADLAALDPQQWEPIRRRSLGLS